MPRPARVRSFADVLPRIVDGSIEAVLSSGDGGAGRKLWDYLPYFTEIGYAMPLSFGKLSQPLYDGLPADLRTVPALKLSSNPRKEPISDQIAEFLSHLVYGIGTALMYDGIKRLER